MKKERVLATGVFWIEELVGLKSQWRPEKSWSPSGTDRGMDLEEWNGQESGGR